MSAVGVVSFGWFCVGGGIAVPQTQFGAYIDGLAVRRSGKIPTMALARSGGADILPALSGSIDGGGVTASGTIDGSIERSGSADIIIEP